MKSGRGGEGKSTEMKNGKKIFCSKNDTSLPSSTRASGNCGQREAQVLELRIRIIGRCVEYGGEAELGEENVFKVVSLIQPRPIMLAQLRCECVSNPLSTSMGE